MVQKGQLGEGAGGRELVVMVGEAPVRAPLVSQGGLGVCARVGRLERC
jgi:hypothetical protein